MPWIKNEPDGSQTMRSQSGENLGIYKTPEGNSRHECTCGEKPHRASCAVGFNNYFLGKDISKC